MTFPLQNQCVPFEYTGCGGNLNNFQSLSDCISTCGQMGFWAAFPVLEFQQAFLPYTGNVLQSSASLNDIGDLEWIGMFPVNAYRTSTECYPWSSYLLWILFNLKIFMSGKERFLLEFRKISEFERLSFLLHFLYFKIFKI